MAVASPVVTETNTGFGSFSHPANNNKIVKIEAILSDYFSKGFLSTVNQRNLDDIVFELYQLTKEEICFIYDATDIRRFSNNL